MPKLSPIIPAIPTNIPLSEEQGQGGVVYQTERDPATGKLRIVGTDKFIEEPIGVSSPAPVHSSEE